MTACTLPQGCDSADRRQQTRTIVASWADLDHELTLWRRAGATPALWWRDDDAVAPTAALDRLLGLLSRHALPLHLAVIPEKATSALARRLDAEPGVDVLQHGYAHVNHEPRGTGASEMGLSRALEAQCHDLKAGWQRLVTLGLPNLLPVFAAPWNRVGPQTPGVLAALGYRVLSTKLVRPAASPAPGITQINVHVDPIRWKTGVAFRGEAGTLSALVGHLARKRTGDADPDEPTGLNTHHLQTDAQVWAFLEALAERLAHRDDVRWIRLADQCEGL